jgi:hypothetical protein
MKNIYRTLVCPSIVLALLLMSGCSKYVIAIHDNESPKNHYVVIKKTGGSEMLLDCYSRPDSTWEPVCKEVREQHINSWTGKYEQYK